MMWWSRLFEGVMSATAQIESLDFFSVLFLHILYDVLGWGLYQIFEETSLTIETENEMEEKTS